MDEHPPSPTRKLGPKTDGKKTRVKKACDRCRVKKAKCDGSNPCKRCRSNDFICIFGPRKRSIDKAYPSEYVEMLETQQSQLVKGLQELHKRIEKGEGWIGTAPREFTPGNPLTHDILNRLGVLNQEKDDTNEPSKDNIASVHRPIIERGAGYITQAPMSGGCSEFNQSAVFDQTLCRTHGCMDPFVVSQFSPVASDQSPPSASGNKGSSSSTQSPVPPTSALSAINPTLHQTWMQPPMYFDESGYLGGTCESPISMEEMSSQSFPQHRPSVGTYPDLSGRYWAEDHVLQQFLDPMAFGKASTPPNVV